MSNKNSYTFYNISKYDFIYNINMFLFRDYTETSTKPGKINNTILK